MRDLTRKSFEGRAGGAQLPRPPLKLPSQSSLMGSGKREGSAVPFPGCNNASIGGGKRGTEGEGRGSKTPVARASSPWEPSFPTENPKRPAVFLDRDGTINEEMGYINHLSRFRLLPEAAPAIRRLNEAKVPVVVVTNQSGAARGYFPASLVDEVHRLMHRLLAQAGAHVDAVYACLHAPDAGCPCRKPKPGLLIKAAEDLGLDLSRSFLVGDRYLDIQTAVNAGAQGILVLTGYGRGEYEHGLAENPAQPVYVAENLLDAVDFILAQR